MATALINVAAPETPPRVVSARVNAGLAEPIDLPSGPQPSSWRQQRSEIRGIVVQFDQPMLLDETDLVLTNLGRNAPADPDEIVPLLEEHLELTGNRLTLRFNVGESSAGVSFSLRLTCGRHDGQT